MFHTGLRRGEALTLRWEDIDFDEGRLWVRRAAELGGASTKVPKTKRGRWMPLSGSLTAALRTELKRQMRLRLKNYRECDWVCPSPNLMLWRERNFSRAFERLRAKHFGLNEIRPLTLHCTRHSFITWALSAGVPTATVSAWTGVSIRVIETTYAHVIPQVGGVDFLDRPQTSTGRPQDRTRESGASA